MYVIYSVITLTFYFTETGIVMDTDLLNKLTKKEFEPLKLIEFISLICAVITGLFLSTLKISSIATDFFEAIPEERTAKLVKSSFDCGLEFGNKKGHEKKPDDLLGGGDSRHRVTRKGVLGMINNQIKAQSIASSNPAGFGGFATDIDAILNGAQGLKTGGRGGIIKKNLEGIGVGKGSGNGFGGDRYDKPSITYSPKFITAKLESAAGENPFINTDSETLSTFSIDVDNASYNNILYHVRLNMLPPSSNIRIEEMINNFSYDYPVPSGSHPLSVVTEVSGCPWELSHRILRIGIKGRSLPPQGPPPSNFVFLIDVSGSMATFGKLPLFKQGLRSFASSLQNRDRISIITYAGEAGLHLAPTPGNRREVIYNAIDKLKSGGSTAGSEGIQLAYRLVNNNFIRNGNNRIILVTDGNFNVGESNEKDLVRLIEKKRGNGIFLTVIGMNVDHEQDEKTMEQLANNGDGNFASVYNAFDLQRVLSSMGETFFTVAKDVKIQVQFNPESVKAYRLIGYENRMLQSSEFTDDTKDAGEIGAEQAVTALYEIVPVRQPDYSRLFCAVNIRYKNGDESESRLMTSNVYDRNKQIEMSSSDYRFATAVAGFGLLLLNSSYKGTCTYDAVIDLARSAAGGPYSHERYEFIDVVKKCKILAQEEVLSFK